VISFYILESIPKHQCILDDLMALMVSKQLWMYWHKGVPLGVFIVKLRESLGSVP
jgi:hypothetical protein